MQKIELRRGDCRYSWIFVWFLTIAFAVLLPGLAHGQAPEESPEVQAPEVQAPEESPEVQAPEVQVPEGSPEGQAPEGSPEGQAPEPTTRSNEPCEGRVDGHVVDSVSHNPVEGVQVTAAGEPVALTDAYGRFFLKGLCSADVQLNVSRLDYQGKERVVSSSSNATVEFELVPQWSEVVVIQGESREPTTMLSTAVISDLALERTRGRSFSEVLADVPGVSELRSASGMAKPVVRGQFGRRLLLLVDSVPHRSQEWGLDHAPEIDPFAAGEIKVVRGAAGVRYGPGAIGGAVLVEPPQLLTSPGMAVEGHLMGFLNRGAGVATRLQVAPTSVPGLAYQLEGTGKRLASPSTPDYALQNTGVSEWSLAGTVGYRRRNAEYTMSFRHYQARLGVCVCLQIESSEDFQDQLLRKRPINSELFESGFSLERPNQQVAHEQALARGRWTFDGVGKLSATYAFQFDHRQEFDVVRNATGPQFDFRLTTHDVDATLEHRSLHINNHLHVRGSAGATGILQVHSYRGLPLVPDYLAAGGGVFAIERLIGHDFELEAGVRYDFLSRNAGLARNDFLRLVRSEQLAMDSCSDRDDTFECDSIFHTISASVGGLLRLSGSWSIKLDLSTASRPPSPDEQYLNGTSPTFPVFGLGKPDLESETTYSASFTSTYRSEQVAAEASVYANRISDYIYFAPAIDASGQPIFDVLIRGSFPRFITRPVDAVFYGADGGITWQPLPALELASQVSLVRAKNQTDRSFLVLVPSDRARVSATYTHQPNDSESLYVLLATTVVARQNRFDPLADLAPPPDGYAVIDAQVGGQTTIGENIVKFAVHGTNLLNARYRDYTSLLRYFADQPGRQIMLRLSFYME